MKTPEGSPYWAFSSRLIRTSPKQMRRRVIAVVRNRKSSGKSSQTVRRMASLLIALNSFTKSSLNIACPCPASFMNRRSSWEAASVLCLTPYPNWVGNNLCCHHLLHTSSSRRLHKPRQTTRHNNAPQKNGLMVRGTMPENKLLHSPSDEKQVIAQFSPLSALMSMKCWGSVPSIPHADPAEDDLIASTLYRSLTVSWAFELIRKADEGDSSLVLIRRWGYIISRELMHVRREVLLCLYWLQNVKFLLRHLHSTSQKSEPLYWML